MKVFIVDDSPLIRERLREMLAEIPGIHLAGQTSQFSGTLETVLAAKPDVIILDVQLSDGSGINILKKLKLSETPLIKIILTAFPNSIYRRRCMEAGADYFLDKTVDFDHLAEVITDLARKKIESFNDSGNKASRAQEELSA